MFMDTRIFVVLISSGITILIFTFEFEVKLYVRQIVLQRKPFAIFLIKSYHKCMVFFEELTGQKIYANDNDKGCMAG